MTLQSLYLLDDFAKAPSSQASPVAALVLSLEFGPIA